MARARSTKATTASADAVSAQARVSTLGMWDRLVGQQQAVRTLRDAVAHGATGHAYLFVGPEGVGRVLAALALAASLNCDRGGCGECSVCARTLRRAHPDVQLIVPEGAQILVDQVREVRAAAFRSPMEGATKVFIFEDAHKLNPTAANALLKVLEEPPGDVLFVLMTSSPDDLLPTIASRCRRVTFYALGPAEITRVLVEHHGVAPEHAAWAARAGDDLSTALRLAKDADAPARRGAHLELPGRLVRSGPGEAVRVAAELAEEARSAVGALAVKQKEELARTLESFGEGRGTGAIRKRVEDRHKREARRIETAVYDSALRDVASFYRDVLLTSAGAPPETLTNTELGERIARAAAVADPAWLVAAIERIEQTRRALARNAAPALALEALFMELGTPRARSGAPR